jgi:hypothetical protein
VIPTPAELPKKLQHGQLQVTGPAQPVDIAKASIEERTELKTSLMPNGLVDRLAREDVFDLLAYIASGGDANHPAFRRKD